MIVSAKNLDGMTSAIIPRPKSERKRGSELVRPRGDSRSGGFRDPISELEPDPFEKSR
jgi:hypothetical protein